MFKACKFSLFDSKATDDLWQDEDEQPDLACTSQLQKWHKKGRSDKISAQSVMEVTITKTKLDDTKSREGVKWDHVYFVHPSTDTSVDMSTEMCRSTYRSMYIGRVMVDISTDYRQISRSI